MWLNQILLKRFLNSDKTNVKGIEFSGDFTQFTKKNPFLALSAKIFWINWLIIYTQIKMRMYFKRFVRCKMNKEGFKKQKIGFLCAPCFCENWFYPYLKITYICKNF